MKWILVTPVDADNKTQRPITVDMQRAESIERDGDATLILFRYRDPLRVRETPARIQALLDEA